MTSAVCVTCGGTGLVWRDCRVIPRGGRFSVPCPDCGGAGIGRPDPLFARDQERARAAESRCGRDSAQVIFRRLLGRKPEHGADDLLLRRLGKHFGRSHGNVPA